MLPEFLQYILFIGFAGLMFLLRLDAKRFSAAEWDTEDGDWRVWLAPARRGTAAGLALALIIFALHPSAGLRPQPRASRPTAARP